MLAGNRTSRCRQRSWRLPISSGLCRLCSTAVEITTSSTGLKLSRSLQCGEAIHIEPRRIRILSRGGHDWTHCFPAVAVAAKELGIATAILDGEAVVYDAKGRTDFCAPPAEPRRRRREACVFGSQVRPLRARSD